MLTCSRHYFFLRIRVDHHLTKSFDKENFEYKCKNALKLGVLRGKKKNEDNFEQLGKIYVQFIYELYRNIYFCIVASPPKKKKNKKRKKEKENG